MTDIYAGIWEQDGGPPFDARHGMTAAGFQGAFDELIGQGFRPTHVHGYVVGGEERFAAIWEKDGGPPFDARFGLTVTTFQQAFDNLIGQGFRLTHVNAYVVGGEERFAAIWEKDGGPPFDARIGLTNDAYQQAFSQLVGQGFRLRCVSGYRVQGEDRYAAIWQQDGGPSFDARHGMTNSEFQQGVHRSDRAGISAASGHCTRLHSPRHPRALHLRRRHLRGEPQPAHRPAPVRAGIDRRLRQPLGCREAGAPAGLRARRPPHHPERPDRERQCHGRWFHGERQLREPVPPG